MNTRTAVLSVAACFFVPALASAALPDEPTPTSCGIVLGRELDGRVLLYDEHGERVADLDKPGGRTLELGLEPGTYEVVYEQAPSRLGVTVTLGASERRTLERASFRPLERVAVPTHAHEPADEPRGLTLDGRTRVEIFGGLSSRYLEDEDDHVELGGGQGGLAFSHWLREDLALEFQLLATDLDVVEVDDDPWESTETRGSLGLLAGARYYFPKATFGGTFRPYAAGAIGSFSEYYAFSSHHHTDVHRSNTRFGGQVGGGVDFQISRLVSLGLKAAVTFRDGHDPSFGSTFGLGFAWGEGH